MGGSALGQGRGLWRWELVGNGGVRRTWGRWGGLRRCRSGVRNRKGGTEDSPTGQRRQDGCAPALHQSSGLAGNKQAATARSTDTLVFLVQPSDVPTPLLRRFPLERVTEAFQVILDRRVRGKVLLTMAPRARL